MSREFAYLLLDIREAAMRAIRHAEGLTCEEFERDEKTVDAVLRCLTIIGEAAKRVTEPDRAAHPEIPWRRLTGLRDRVVHDYLGTDLSIVWEVLQKSLPELLDVLPPTT